MADHHLPTQSQSASATTPRYGASGRVPTLADYLPDSTLHGVADRLPSEQGGRMAAVVVRELHGGRNHVAVDFSAISPASYAEPVSSTAAYILTEASYDDVEVEENLIPVGLRSADDYLIPSQSTTTTPGDGASRRVPTLADYLPDSTLHGVADRLPSEQGERMAAVVVREELHGGRSHVAMEFSVASPASYAEPVSSTAAYSSESVVYTLADDLLDLGLRGVADRLPDQEAGETFATLFRELRGGPNHGAVEFCAANFAANCAANSVPRRSLAAALFVDDTESTDGEGEGDGDGNDDGDEGAGVALDPADADRDRISGLPDDMLLIILGRVPFVDAVKTCVQGRRWRELWTRLPHLSVDDTTAADAGVTSFPNFVDGVFARYDGRRHIIRDLTLTVRNPNNMDGARLAAWSSLAAQRVSGPVSFILDFGDQYLQHFPNTPFEFQFLVPQLQASATSIRVCISHPEEILFSLGPSANTNRQFGALTQLILCGTRFSPEGARLFSDIVCNSCPVLTILRLEDVRDVASLVLSSDSLVDVTAIYLPDLKSVKIAAEKLERIQFGYSFVGKEDTELKCSKQQRLKEIVWNDSWPTACDFGEAVMVDKLTVHRRNDPKNLERVLTHFRRYVTSIVVLVSLREDPVEVETEVVSMKTPRKCDIYVKLYCGEEED